VESAEPKKSERESMFHRFRRARCRHQLILRRHISRSDHDNDEDDDEVVCCAAMSVTGRVWLLSTLAATAIFVCLLNLGVGIYYSPSTRTTDDYDTHHHHGVAPPRMTALLPRHAASPATTMDHHHRPPLDSILQGEWNITGDVSWLLHFAVIGHPKCATSTMMKLLGTHPEVSIFQDERCDLAYNQQAKLIRDSYLYLKTNTTRGFKCPALLESTQLGMRNAIRFFPKMKYIVGIRHPGTVRRKSSWRAKAIFYYICIVSPQARRLYILYTVHSTLV
jgi:hypothetical protein